jgi:SNF2 family DNA or RNA helicase
MGKQNSVSKAYDILKTYNGTNNQIRYYKSLYDNGRLILEDFGVQYILNNYDYEPIEVNKNIKIAPELGETMKEKFNLDFIPPKIHITKIIGEMGGSYHGYVKSKTGTQLLYLKKKYLLDKLVDIDYHTLDIDFDVYDNMPSANGRKLKEHQKTGAKFLIANKKCVLADSMGTGKTTTSIIASLAGGYKNILVITTASLKTTWYKDLILYVPKEDINIVSGSKWDPGKKYTILNYDIIDNFYEVPMEPVFDIEEIYDQEGKVVETLKVPVMVKDKTTGNLIQKMQKSRKKADIQKALNESPLFWENYDCVIIDEAQKLSNNGSIRYRTIYDFLRKANPKAIFLLTGTPLTNRPNNLYNILKLIDADITRDYNYFLKRYCGGVEMKLRDGRTIIKSGDATNLDELRERIKDIYIRRLASETGEMVEKSVLRKYYDLNDKQKVEYDRLWREYQDAQENIGKYDTEQYRQLVEGMLVRQYLAKEMTKHTIELAEDYIESGEKVVIITCFQEEMDILQKHFGKKCVIYNGKMLPKQKDKAQDEFQNNPKIKVFIGQVIACGVGLSLPVARTLIFNSYDWVAANNKQAEDRIYRLTQTRDVECIYQLFTDSISQDMFDKVIYKELIANQTIKSEKEKELIK